MEIGSGITLIALVVTIVVLIILATVSINIVFSEDGIIKRAEQAKDMYANSLETEQDALDKLVEEYANIIGESESTTSTWEYDQASQTVTNGTMTLNIGDYVDYNPQEGATETSYTSEQANNGYGDQVFTLSEYTYGWRVLGVDEETRELLLIAEDFVPLTGGRSNTTSGRTEFYLKSQDGYVNGANELNNICAIYGQGKGATGARSVTVEDINNITGYNPEATGDGNPAYSGQVNEYGNKVTYTLNADDNYVYYQGTKYPTTSTSSTYTSFTYYTGEEWKTLATGESAEITSDCYRYYPNTLTDSSTADTEPGISTESTAYKMLFTNSSTGAYSAGSGATGQFWYWLAGPYVNADTGSALFGLRDVVIGCVNYENLCRTNGIGGSRYRGVRPVVTLASDVQLVDSGTDRDGCDLYNIK